ncbi:hypothetical protein LCGC14_2927230 [marine sediment metagenome]|uniref:Uncharacterized protein n=1 Tax=marine sediment metagenome TaxID=412755 RepID=A0A0F8Y8U2_9ZZZZ
MAVVAEDLTIREIEPRETPLGPVLYVKVQAAGYRPLSWREVWEAFAARYPDRWAFEMFPPAAELVDGKAVYHLFVLPPDFEPGALNIKAA